jgi:hypothetical protein
VPGPSANSTTSIGLILTTEPQGPYALLPSGATNTSNPKPPDAVLLENCTLSSYDSTGKAVFSTPLPAGSDPVGPCQLIMDKNGTLYIRDLGNDGAVLWSNEVQTNRTAATCSPYSLAVLTNGMLVERDCANRTVWSVPQLAGKQGPRGGPIVHSKGGCCVVCLQHPNSGGMNTPPSPTITAQLRCWPINLLVRAAVVSPVTGPNTTTGSYILTTEPQGPFALLPVGAANVSNVTAPYAVLAANCSLATYGTGGTPVYATPPGDAVGPCRCVQCWSLCLEQIP